MAKITGIDPETGEMLFDEPEIRTDDEARKEGYIFKIVGRADLPVETTSYVKDETTRDAVVDWFKRNECPNPVVTCIS